MELVRRLYIAAGIIWGVILGIAAGLYVAAGVAGIFWLYIFGDNTWPEWAWGAAYTFGIITGVLTFGFCIYFSWSYCKRLPLIEANQNKETGKAASLLALAFMVVIGYLAFDNYQTGKHAALSRNLVEAEKRRMEDASPHRKVGEDDVDFYCRVTRKQSKLELIYKGDRIKIVPELLLANGQVLFAAAGKYDLIKELAEEILIREEIIAGNKILISDFAILPEDVRCGEKLFFIRSNASIIQNPIKELERVNCSIPSAKVVFPMAVRIQ